MCAARLGSRSEGRAGSEARAAIDALPSSLPRADVDDDAPPGMEPGPAPALPGPPPPAAGGEPPPPGGDAAPTPAGPPPGWAPPPSMAPGGWRPPYPGAPFPGFAAVALQAPPPAAGPPPVGQEGSLGYTTGLSLRGLAAFKARDPLPFLAPPRKRPARVAWTGIAPCVSEFAENDADVVVDAGEGGRERLTRNKEYPLQVRLAAPLPLERARDVARARVDAADAARAAGVAAYAPGDGKGATGDPYKTLFVGRLPYGATERALRREFEEFGPIARVVLVTAPAKEGKKEGEGEGGARADGDADADAALAPSRVPRGYAFIEYEHAADMKAAYKHGDGRRVGGRAAVVDVERGRAVAGWRPARLGGGKGGESRAPREPRNAKKREKAGLPALPKGFSGGLGGPPRFGGAPQPPFGGPPPPFAGPPAHYGGPPPSYGGPPPPWGAPPPHGGDRPFDRGGRAPPPPGWRGRSPPRGSWRRSRTRSRSPRRRSRSRDRGAGGRSRDRSRSPRSAGGRSRDRSRDRRPPRSPSSGESGEVRD